MVTGTAALVKGFAGANPVAKRNCHRVQWSKGAVFAALLRRNVSGARAKSAASIARMCAIMSNKQEKSE
jgi:hypothetical protein